MNNQGWDQSLNIEYYFWYVKSSDLLTLTEMTFKNLLSGEFYNHKENDGL